MNIIFLTIGKIESITEHSIYNDLLREIKKNGHNVYVVSPNEKRYKRETEFIEDNGIHILRVKVGNITKSRIIEKGIATIKIEGQYIRAIKKYLRDVKFDLVVYTTPPITFVKVVEYIKKRNNAKSYLLLKDIFPQNAVDIGLLSKTGIKGVLYRYFRKKEKRLYILSDKIGCMSQANCDYILKNNPYIEKNKVEICPNCIEFQDLRINDIERKTIREKYGFPLDKKIFIYGGNLGKPQGVPFLIDCLKAIGFKKDVFFVIVGNGTEYEKLTSYVKECKPAHVKLMKILPKEEYDKMTAACDFGLIFLDYRFTIPNFPSRLLSYMQAGIPILACTDSNTDIGKIILEGEFGFWCESTDTDGFVKIVDSALSCDNVRLGNNGITYLQKHYLVSNAYQTMIRITNESFTN